MFCSETEDNSESGFPADHVTEQAVSEAVVQEAATTAESYVGADGYVYDASYYNQYYSLDPPHPPPAEEPR